MHPTPPHPAPSTTWWVPPLISSVLVVPGTVVMLWLVGISAMGFAPCGPDDCPRAELHHGIGKTMLVVGLIPALLGWFLPRRTTFDLARWALLLVYIATFLIGATALFTLPAGE